MERFENLNVDNYSLLAKYYDYLLGDEDSFDIWLNEICKKPFKTVLELASGSGVMAQKLKDKGYDIIASDISKEMMEAAKANYDGEYLILDMTNYNLNKKFDLILCICDSINYLRLDQISDFLKCAKKHLNKNGRIIFDMHSIKRIDEFSTEYIEEGELFDLNQYQWTILSDNQDMTLNECFTFYLNDVIIQEHHTQYVHKIKDINMLLIDNGFKPLILDDFVKDEKILVIGEFNEKMV